MFTMMNNARLLVGIQGVAVAEAATQRALAYANDRRQGKADGYNGEGMAPIIHHPDVQRNIMTMRALTNAARAISYNCAHAIDEEHSAGEGEAYWSDRAALLTPVAKAFSTDIGVEVASIGIQVHGGMGFIEETGAAQLLRDARIAPIYEGTNGIQAIDLVTRKLTLSGGEAVAVYIRDLSELIDAIQNSNMPGLSGVADRLRDALEDMRATTTFLLKQLEEGNRSGALAGATPYLKQFGLTAGSIYLAQSAIGSDDAVGAERASIARFAAFNLLSETKSLRATIENGADSLSDAAEHLISA